jgi:2-oxoisovalerate dehydrogenase E1 component alpha subunit
MSTAADVEIRQTAYIAPDGAALRPLPEALAEPAVLTALYRGMVLARTFDAKAIALQRTGRLGTYASLLGQEAVGVGIAKAMRPDDVLLPSFREHALQIQRGVKPEEVFLYWGGDERGSAFSGPPEDFPVGITVGAHAPQAAGVGLAFKLRGEPRVAVCVFGDGATSKGDVYEALNVAGVWELPVVFVAVNNQWAISTPRSAQTAAPTLAHKATAAGIPGEQVDGNDVVAVADVIGAALERARSGQPSLVECLTYRLGDHTTVDDASRYRSDEEVSGWWQRDPIARMRAFLVENGLWDKGSEESLLTECGREIDDAAERYLAMEPDRPAAMFDHLYAELPDALAAQRAAVQEGEADG